MAKFTGFMCDGCGKAENGNDRPEEWLGVMLPVNGNGSRESRDLCSDKCLVKFARERAGDMRTYKPKSSRKSIPGLREYFDSIGLRPAMIGPKMAVHARSQHEMKGAVSDCPICEFQTRKVEE